MLDSLITNDNHLNIQSIHLNYIVNILLNIFYINHFCLNNILLYSLNISFQLHNLYMAICISNNYFMFSLFVCNSNHFCKLNIYPYHLLDIQYNFICKVGRLSYQYQEYIQLNKMCKLVLYLLLMNIEYSVKDMICIYPFVNLKNILLNIMNIFDYLNTLYNFENIFNILNHLKNNLMCILSIFEYFR